MTQQHTIGDRYQDTTGNTHIVAAISQDGPAPVPMLLEDFDIREEPNTFEWDPCTWEWAQQHWGPLQPIDSDPELTLIVTIRAARTEEMTRIIRCVSSEYHRDLYNTLAACTHYAANLYEAQAEVDRVSAHRARELRSLVDIVGTQDRAARLLGMNQSTLSRALRPRAQG